MERIPFRFKYYHHWLQSTPQYPIHAAHLSISAVFTAVLPWYARYIVEGDVSTEVCRAVLQDTANKLWRLCSVVHAVCAHPRACHAVMQGWAPNTLGVDVGPVPLLTPGAAKEGTSVVNMVLCMALSG